MCYSCLYCYLNDSGFVLSDDLDIIKLNKVAIMASDFFALSINNKKIVTKLLKRFVESANDDMQVAENYQEICSKMMQLASKFEDMVDFQITYDESFSIEDIIKLLNVKFEEKAFDSVLDKLIDFVSVASEFSICEIIVFVNIKSYLSEAELKELYKCAQYKKVNLFLLENCNKTKIEGEKIVIIDEDKCEILG
ncbi:MAG: type II-A CRISPR-associated protein Csn2 [Clostridia bacterium]